MKSQFVILALAMASPALAQTTAESPRPAPKLSGYIQARETYRKGPGLTATLNRARLGADGSVKPNLAYRVLVEFEAVSGTSGTVSLRDAYLRWTRNWLSATGGQFKTPFSREYLTSITQIETADRSVAVDSLAPKRDVGVMAEATKPYGSLSAGVFNGEGQNVVVNRDSTVMLVGRAVLRPPGPIWIAGDIAERGTHRRTLGAEASFEYRGAIVRSEYLAERVDGRARDHYGWFVLGGYRVLPWLQVIARQEDFQRPSLGPARRITATTGGLNFDFRGGQTRLILDYVDRETGAARTHSHDWIAQLQARF